MKNNIIMKYHDLEKNMVNLNDIHSITDFQRNPKGILNKLKESENPIVLTVNGKAELVVQDAQSYQKLLDKLQYAEDLEAIREGLAQSLRGDGRPIEEFFAEFDVKHGI
ncbi:MAG: type II toxin-antitoxin system Phd/YefM family antitoxin [Rickettsiales bacterium]